MAGDADDLVRPADYYTRALAIHERLRAESEDFAQVLHTLGVLHESRDDPKAARPFYERSLAMKERVAPESLSLALILHNLGALLTNERDFAERPRPRSQALPRSQSSRLDIEG